MSGPRVVAPDEAGRAAILRKYLQPMPLAPDVCVAELARQTAGLSGTDLESLVREAGFLAVKEAIAGDTPVEAVCLRQAHLRRALAGSFLHRPTHTPTRPATATS